MTWQQFVLAVCVGIVLGVGLAFGYGLLMARSWADDEKSER